MVELSEEDRARLEAAVASAESRTGAEIVVMAVERATDTRAAEMTAAGILALALPGALLPFSQVAALTIWLAQLVLFIVLGFLFPFFGAGRVLIGGKRLTAQVRAAAEAQFFSHGLRNTEDRAAVLIFTALGERRIEVLCDDRASEAVSDAEWRGLAGDLARRLRAGDVVGGLEAAAARAGELLAPHFPHGPDDRNELPDVIVS